MAVCEVCFRHCCLEEGQTGACYARKNINGNIVAANYGMLTALALDPIEKKPLARFHPGSQVVSIGSFGCNLKCPFCQNVDISLADGGGLELQVRQASPEALAGLCEEYKKDGNIGIAYTYNEPLVGYEFVRDTAILVKERGMKNVLVTNGCVSLSVLEEIGPYMDAMNIDLKSFDADYYESVLKGNLEMVKAFIRRAAEFCHVELTMLVIPDENDDEQSMRKMARWIAETGKAAGREIPLHVTRFFPRSRYADRTATDVEKVYRLAEAAREYLEYVYTGNC